MIQRATQHSGTEHLDDDDASECHDRDVAHIKQTTPVDLDRTVYLGTNRYHVTPGCFRGQGGAGTIADAIEQGLSPCRRCNPPDYRSTVDETPVSDETTEQETQADDEDSPNQHASTDDITLALPETTPTSVADLEPFVIAHGDVRRTAHIAARSEPIKPLCVAIGTYHGVGHWTMKSQAVYPNPSERFTLCRNCLAAYERIDGGE